MYRRAMFSSYSNPGDKDVFVVANLDFPVLNIAIIISWF